MKLVHKKKKSSLTVIVLQNLKNGSFIIEICSFRKNVLEWKMLINNNCFNKNLNNEKNIIIEICSFRKNVHIWKMFIYEICSNVKFVLTFEMIKIAINHKWKICSQLKIVHIWKIVNIRINVHIWNLFT
jgi:hypothetical protein